MSVGLIGFGTTNLFDGKITKHSLEQGSLVAEHVESPRPGEQFAAAHGTVSGSFDVDADNNKIDIFLAAAEHNVGISSGSFSAEALAVIIQTRIVTTTSDSGFRCSYDSAAGKFRVWHVGSTAFSILWKTGVNGTDGTNTSIGTEIGFKATADDTGTSSYYSNNVVWHRHTWVMFDLLSAGKANPDVLAITLAGDDDTSFTDVKGYAMVGLPAFDTRFQMAAVAGVTYTFSDRGTRADREGNIINPIQIAVGSGSTTHRYFVVSWRHEDTSTQHRIGMARAYTMLKNTTRTVRELGDHRIVDPSEPIGPSNYYPTQLKRFWNIPLVFTDWLASSWRTVFLPLTQHGKTDVVLYAQHWSFIFAGTIALGDVDDEADNGFLCFASIVEEPTAEYSGQASDYLSGDLLLIQAT